MEKALQVANQALVEECEQGRMDHLYKIVIITDGEPNCGTDGPNASDILSELPAEWAEHGIDTFVFGLPGSESAEALLTDIAEAGGSDNYFAPYKPVTVYTAPDGGAADGGTVDRTPDDVRDDIILVVV